MIHYKYESPTTVLSADQIEELEMHGRRRERAKVQREMQKQLESLEVGNGNV